MRGAAGDEDRFAGLNLALLIADAETEAPFEDEPCLVVGAVQVQPGDRTAGMCPGSVQFAITNESLMITVARGTTRDPGAVLSCVAV